MESTCAARFASVSNTQIRTCYLQIMLITFKEQIPIIELMHFFGVVLGNIFEKVSICQQSPSLSN